MILVDTNVIIDYLQGNESILTDLIGKEDIAICGIILAELLHGINSDTEKQLLNDASNDFEWISLNDSLWQSVGMNLNLLRKNGLIVPFQDAVLATLCIEHNMSIVTNDKHFEKIAQILTGLKIFS